MTPTPPCCNRPDLDLDLFDAFYRWTGLGRHLPARHKQLPQCLLSFSGILAACEIFHELRLPGAGTEILGTESVGTPSIK